MLKAKRASFKQGLPKKEEKLISLPPKEQSLEPAVEEEKDEDVVSEAEEHKSERDSLLTNEGEEINRHHDKDNSSLFPMFRKTHEKKNDGSQRICIRCLRSKPDRCHH